MSCAQCAAPLHDLKALPVKQKSNKAGISHQPALRRFAAGKKAAEVQRRKSKKRKPRKSLWRRMAEEAFDVVEDIFD